MKFFFTLKDVESEIQFRVFKLNAFYLAKVCGNLPLRRQGLKRLPQVVSAGCHRNDLTSSWAGQENSGPISTVVSFKNWFSVQFRTCYLGGFSRFLPPRHSRRLLRLHTRKLLSLYISATWTPLVSVATDENSKVRSRVKFTINTSSEKPLIRPVTDHMDFEIFFNQICADLKGDVQQTSRQFSQCDTDKKYVEFVYSLKPVSFQIEKLNSSLKYIDSGKSPETATSFRNQGNLCFQKKLYSDALKYYNQSILAAPSDRGSELSLAYANRSAVLFDLGEWIHCLRDILLAFFFKYPENLHYKLFERQGNCWLKLSDTQKASNSFTLALDSLKQVTFNQERFTKILTSLKEKLSRIKISAKDTGDLSGKETTIESLEQVIRNRRTTPPALYGRISQNLLCASEFVEMAYSVEKGRHLIANNDLEPGKLS